MARPTTKETLETIAQEKFDKMCGIIDKMSRTQQEAPFSPEMAFAGKETHWARDKNLEMFWCIFMSGISCCLHGLRLIPMVKSVTFCPNLIIGGTTQI